MISVTHRTIFVHVPKCAGQAIEAAFLHDLAPDAKFATHRHLLSCLPRPQGWSEAFPFRLAHLKAHEYLDLDFVPRSLWDASFKFAVVRDPLERAISMWRYLSTEGDFEAFATQHLPAMLAQSHFFYASQYVYTHAPGSGECLVDRLVPIERLEQEWPGICEKAGLKLAPLRQRNKARRERPSEISETARASISSLYADDYEHLADYFERPA